MRSPLLVDLNAYALVALVFHWAVLWLGLYLIGRRPRVAGSVLVGSSFVCGAVYLVAAAYFYIPSTVQGVALREQWLGGWVIFTPALLLHGLTLLAGFTSRWRKWLLIYGYVFAAAVFVGNWFSGVFSDFKAATLDKDGYLSVMPLGRIHWVLVLQLVSTLALSVLVLARVRFARPAPPKVVLHQLGWMKSGMVLMVVGATLINVNRILLDTTLEIFVIPVGIIAGIMVAVPIVRYAGRPSGQLLWRDAWSSLIATVVTMAVYLSVGLALDASAKTMAGTGWLVIVVVALGGELRGLGDRLAYGRGGRAARSGLRTAEAYAGTTKSMDLDALVSGASAEVVGYLSDLDRAVAVSAGLGLGDADWLRLLARAEFSAVREALEMPEDWGPGDGLSLPEIRERMAAKLLPRERQALGLWYLGHSDKDMARLMGVKPNVPRSYLSEAKKKIGLPSGPPLTLFVHFAGFAGSDALPLL